MNDQWATLCLAPFVTEGEVEEPTGRVVYSFRSVYGREVTRDMTEGFQERVEPPIIELEAAFGCDAYSDAISLSELLSDWPAGKYEFSGGSRCG